MTEDPMLAVALALAQAEGNLEEQLILEAQMLSASSSLSGTGAGLVGLTK